MKNVFIFICIGIVLFSCTTTVSGNHEEQKYVYEIKITDGHPYREKSAYDYISQTFNDTLCSDSAAIYSAINKLQGGLIAEYLSTKKIGPHFPHFIIKREGQNYVSDSAIVNWELAKPLNVDEGYIKEVYRSVRGFGSPAMMFYSRENADTLGQIIKEHLIDVATK